MSKFTKARVDAICDLVASDDYTIPEICKQVGISESIYHKWKQDHLEFLEALQKAEQKRLEKFKQAARQGLLTLLQGKEYEETATEWVEGKAGPNGEPGKPKIKSRKTTKKFILPNPTSVIFALKNLDEQNFSDVLKVEHTKIKVSRR